MKKRILCALLALVMLMSFAACGEKESNDDGGKKSDSSTSSGSSSDGGNSNAPSKGESIPHTGKRLDGEIDQGTAFHEGLAFVCINGDEDRTYCINTEGYIVFEADEFFPYCSSYKFVNGMALINGNIYDTAGKCTTPESVGATKFYNIAFEDGYILAEKVTADYSTTKKELGVMNKNFQWIVEPKETLYQAVESQLHAIIFPDVADSYYYQDYVCFQDGSYSPSFDNVSLYLNLKTGELTEEAPFETPAHGLFHHSKGLCDYQGNIIIDLSKYENIHFPYGSEFVDGKRPVVFYNYEAEKCYFSFIDETGEFLFEPKELENVATYSQPKFRFDGETLLIVDDFRSPNIVQSYDIQGNMIAQLETKNLSYHFSDCEINDGIICVSDTAGIRRNGGYYYTTDFQPLF